MLTNDSNSPCGILYIDDEEKALKYFRMAFSDKFKVFTASSGREGLETLRRESRHIGIVLSDQRMPEMLGAELLGRVREEYPNIVRILTTAYSDLDSAIQAVNQGYIYQYVVKPWEIPELGMVLQRAADYFRILTERNELLALKMATLQRILCSDRVKWLLLSVRSWAPPAQAAFRSALAALLSGLPENSAFIEGGKVSARQFEVSGLIRGEFGKAAPILGALDRLAAGTPSASYAWEALVQSLAAKYALSVSPSYTLAGDAVSPSDLSRDLFGLLFGETTSASLQLFELLFSLASSSSRESVSISSLTFDLPAEPVTDEAVIDALTRKFSTWDLARL